MYVQRMKSYIDILENLGVQFPKELAIDIVLNSLSSLYQQFIMNYNMKNMEKNMMEIHDMLKIVEEGMQKTRSSNSTSLILAIGHDVTKRKNVFHLKGKGKTKVGHFNECLKRKVDSKIAPNSKPNEFIFFYYQSKGHQKRSFPKYHKEQQIQGVRHLKYIFMIELHSTSTSNFWFLDTICGTHIFYDMQ